MKERFAFPLFTLFLTLCLPGPLHGFPSDLPNDPAIPGIPGQKAMPSTVPMTLVQEPDGVRVVGGGLEVKVTMSPFTFEVSRATDGETLIVSSSAPCGGFAPLAFTWNEGDYWNTFYWGYRGYWGIDLPWAHARRVDSYRVEDDRVLFDIKTNKTLRGRTLFVVGPFYDGAVRIAAAVKPGLFGVNRLAFTFHAPGDEHYVGFGERFNSVDQRGKILENWSEEGSIEPGELRPLLEPILPGLTPEWALPGGEDSSYCPVPFFISSLGYGLLADVPEPSHFDLAATFGDLWRIMVESDSLSVVVFAGPTPADALAQYTKRTGRSQVPRPWVFGPWNMFVGYPGLGQVDVARAFREADIPSGLTQEWTDITPTGGFLGHETAILARNSDLHELGYKSLCYLQPRIDKDLYPELWDEGAAQDHFTRCPGGLPYVQTVYLNFLHMTEFHVSHVDFTHEGAGQWWHGILRTVVDLDYDGTMYDFGEYTPPGAWFSDGRSGHYWHNPYPLIYQRAGYDFFRSLDEDPDDGLAPPYVYFHRSGYAGSQNWTYAMWGGDPEADWSVSDGLPAQICAGVNLGLSGLPYWGSDIGGYHAYLVPAPTTELVKRWYEFGAFSGLMRDMTAPEIAQAPRILVFDEAELTYVVRKFQKLRTQLVPYCMNAAWEQRETGLPLMRAALLHFPDDPNVWDLKREYMFGPDLYITPVVTEGNLERTLYLPPGRWVEFWARTGYDGDLEGNGTGGFRIGGVPTEGGREITVEAPVDEIPVFVRLGAVIPLVDPRVDTFAPAGGPAGPDVTGADDLAHLLHVWAFPEGTTDVTLADGSQMTVEAGADGVTLRRTAQPDEAEVIAQVVWPVDLAAPAQVEGLTYAAGADPLTLEPGTWTWSPERNAAALHGESGRMEFRIRTGR